MSRRKAAAVPASKAQIGVTYAVKYDGELTRFVVNKITTHRIDNTGSPHDYESEITGTLIFREGKTQPKHTIHPSELLGRFEEYAELAAKAEAERKAKIAQAKTENEAALELRQMLYQIAGLPTPNDPSEWHQLFKVGKYGDNNTVDMTKQAVQPLLDGLRTLLKARAA